MAQQKQSFIAGCHERKAKRENTREKKSVILATLQATRYFERFGLLNSFSLSPHDLTYRLCPHDLPTLGRKKKEIWRNDREGSCNASIIYLRSIFFWSCSETAGEFLFQRGKILMIANARFFFDLFFSPPCAVMNDYRVGSPNCFSESQIWGYFEFSFFLCLCVLPLWEDHKKPTFIVLTLALRICVRPCVCARIEARDEIIWNASFIPENIGSRRRHRYIFFLLGPHHRVKSISIQNSSMTTWEELCGMCCGHDNGSDVGENRGGTEVGNASCSTSIAAQCRDDV